MVDIKMDDVLSGRGNGGRYKRPNFPIEFKRQLAELSFEPGASVALIARQNDVNANLLFKWRHQYQAGAFGLPTKPEASAKLPPAMAPVLLPVSIVDELPVEASTSLPTKTELSNTTAEDGICEIDFDHARLRIRGEVSPSVLRLLIRELSRSPQETQ
nr:transposase [Paraburkholderia sp. BCC1885]